jgi:hypothetical protein
VPPLRARGDDIRMLAEYFLEFYARHFKRKLKGFTQSALRAIQAHPWPGNVREMENRVQRAVILARDSYLRPEDLELEEPTAESPRTLQDAREDAEKKLLIDALTRNAGNITRAARTSTSADRRCTTCCESTASRPIVSVNPARPRSTRTKTKRPRARRRDERAKTASFVQSIMTFRWSGRALAACGVTCALLGSPLASPARAWGTVGHEKIAGAVAAVLPSDAEPLLVFGSSLVRHAMDADVRAQQPGTDERFRHRFEVDAYLWWERMFLPLDLLSWEHRFGLDRVRERGLLPWAVGDSYERLVTAFRRHDSNAAAREWADLTHYLADAADPLRCTRDASPELARRIDDRLLDRLPLASRAAAGDASLDPGPQPGRRCIRARAAEPLACARDARGGAARRGRRRGHTGLRRASLARARSSARRAARRGG